VWLKRKELVFPGALLLLPVSMALAYGCNILRLVGLVMIGTEISPSIALRGFHSQAGWISFTVLGIALIWGLESSGWLHHPQQRPEPEQYAYPALPYLMPMVGLLFATMVVQGTTGQFPYSYPLKPLIGLSLLLHYGPQLRPLWRRPGWESLAVGVAVYFLWMALVQPAEAVSPYLAVPQPYTWMWLAMRVLGGVVVVPIVEELAFRGYLLRRLQNADFEQAQGSPPWYAYLASSLAFGLLHSDWLAGILAGLAYAWVSTRRGGLSNAIVAHSVTNLGLAIRAIGWQEWGLW
jgi:exosortase E/protease (VPEID-CTERM system)